MNEDDFEDPETEVEGGNAEEDELLFSTSPGPRIFNLNNATGTTLLGILIEETEDSFLVGLPSRLLDVEGEMKIDPYMPITYARFMKYSVLSVTFLFGIFLEKYVDYLKTTGRELAPDLVGRIDFDEKQEDYEELSEELDEGIEARVKEIQSLGGLILTDSITKH